MLNFDFLKKGLGIFIHHIEFSRKIFLMLYSINRLNFIVWLPLFLEKLGNFCIAVVCFPGCDVTIFEINLIFRINRFSAIQNKKINILIAKRDFKVE